MRYLDCSPTYLGDLSAAKRIAATYQNGAPARSSTGADHTGDDVYSTAVAQPNEDLNRTTSFEPVRVVIMLRDPVERLISHWEHASVQATKHLERADVHHWSVQLAYGRSPAERVRERVSKSVWLGHSMHACMRACCFGTKLDRSLSQSPIDSWTGRECQS
jgi:hypothetical protein